jgi:hypothetical protein
VVALQLLAKICIFQVTAAEKQSDYFKNQLSLFTSLLPPLNPLKSFNGLLQSTKIAFVTRYSLTTGFFRSSSVLLCCTSLTLAQKSGVCTPTSQTRFDSTSASVFELCVLKTRCGVVARPYSSTSGLARRQTCGS